MFKIKIKWKRNIWDLLITVSLIAAFVYFLSGAERLTSDVAIRIRYAFRDGVTNLNISGSPMHAFSVSPNEWPQNCKKNGDYQLQLSPALINNQVQATDIEIFCSDGHHYWTNSTDVMVKHKMRVGKTAEEIIIFALKKTDKGVELVDLE